MTAGYDYQEQSPRTTASSLYGAKHGRQPSKLTFHEPVELPGKRDGVAHYRRACELMRDGDDYNPTAAAVHVQLAALALAHPRVLGAAEASDNDQ